LIFDEVWTLIGEMAMIRRRFVNIVTETHKSGVCSVHRLDVSKHLFYPSTLHAREANTTDGVMVERLQELPEPCFCIQPSLTTVAGSPKVAFFGLVSPGSSESRIRCINDAGHSMISDVDTHFRYSMPSLEGGFKGPVSVSLSVAQAAGAKEQDMYVLHSVADGQELKSRFDVLRFGTAGYSCGYVEGWWYWQYLPPPPPSVFRPGDDLVSSSMVLEGGRTICLSSAAQGVGAYYYLFDTVRGEWSRARDDLGLRFAGRAEYVADLNIWLGFSAQDPRHLCWASGHSALAADKPPTLLPLWQDRTPVEWMASKIDLLNLGSGRFAIAKVCKVIPASIGESGLDEEDEFLVLTGVEIRRGPQTFQHKSIRYICSNDDRIHQVL
jgi:hypothetical protein